MHFSVWLIIGLLTVGFAHAADTECKDATTTAAMRACENSRYVKSDSELQIAYNQLLKQLDNVRQAKLRQAQRAWIAFRDANADFLSSAAQDGTLAPLLKITALADMTETRTKELQRLRKQ